jgi:hypothetical protein
MPHFIFIQQISVLNILNMLYNLHFFSSKCRLFHNATLFGFCITHNLITGCAKIWKKVRRQKVKAIKQWINHIFDRFLWSMDRTAKGLYWTGQIVPISRYFDPKSSSRLHLPCSWNSMHFRNKLSTRCIT